MTARRAFTLIELLVVISIIGILTGIALVALGGAKAGARDARRKGDLEQIRSNLEVYRADCGKFPGTLGTRLTGDGSSASCAATNVYISSVPQDPQSTVYSYYYAGTNTSYDLCAFLETGTVSPSGCGSCGAGGNSATCKYHVGPP